MHRKLAEKDNAAEALRLRLSVLEQTVDEDSARIVELMATNQDLTLRNQQLDDTARAMIEGDGPAAELQVGKSPMKIIIILMDFDNPL